MYPGKRLETAYTWGVFGGLLFLTYIVAFAGGGSEHESAAPASSAVRTPGRPPPPPPPPFPPLAPPTHLPLERSGGGVAQ